MTTTLPDPHNPIATADYRADALSAGGAASSAHAVAVGRAHATLDPQEQT